MLSVTLYGIKNCENVKKARKWLEANSVSYAFHDFRVNGIDKALVNHFLKQIDIEILINNQIKQIVFFHDQQLFTINFDGLAAVLAE